MNDIGEQQWPDDVLIVRHGESAGNVARDHAVREGLPVIDIAKRDCDVPLSALGERQADALGSRLSVEVPKPHAVLASPFVRAQQTAQRMLATAGWNDVPVVVDERLREKEFGMLDRLTRIGIAHRFPEQAEMLARLGKFYYRPPGGESWTDVLLRLRSFVDSLCREYARRNVIVVAHQVIVLCFRYLFENLNESEILTIDREGDVANCSTTRYRYDAQAGDHGGMSLSWYNRVDAVVTAGERVTRAPDAPVAPK